MSIETKKDLLILLFIKNDPNFEIVPWLQNKTLDCRNNVYQHQAGNRDFYYYIIVLFLSSYSFYIYIIIDNVYYYISVYLVLNLEELYRFIEVSRWFYKGFRRVQKELPKEKINLSSAIQISVGSRKLRKKSIKELMSLLLSAGCLTLWDAKCFQWYLPSCK